MTWIEVVDDAVKIGLGGLIAGIFGLLIAHFSHSRDSRARYSQRRQDQLLQLRDILIAIEESYIKQKAAFQKYRQYKTEAPAMASEAEVEFEQLDKSFRASMQGCARLSSMLLLLGEGEADSLLWDYNHALNGWYNKSIPDLESLTDSQLDEVRKKIRSTREKLFESLARAFKAV